MDVTVPSNRPGRHDPGTLLSLVTEGVLDAELAALVSLLVEARVPVLVAGDVDESARAEVLEALLAALPDRIARVRLAGPVEDFAWLSGAESLGWRSDGPTPGRPVPQPTDPETTAIVAGELVPGDATAAWAGVVRIGVRAVSLGYGFGATLRAGSLEDVLATLRGAPYRLTEDELSRLGLVLILAASDGGARVRAAHYLRPVARDMHGHIQKLGPAVLATWDAPNGRFEHFGWGVTPEMALRTGRRAGDFEIEQDRRAASFAAGSIPGPEAPAQPPVASAQHTAHDHGPDDHHDHDHARTQR